MGKRQRYSLVDELLCDLNLEDEPTAKPYLAVALIMLTVFACVVVVALSL